MKPPRRHLALLQRAPGFRLLFFSTLASGIGTWLSVVALTVDVFGRTHSAKWVSALLIADFLPAVVIGLTLGPLVDRLSRKGLMVAADLVRLAVFVALPFTGSPGAIVALAAVAGVATGFFRPASLAGRPNLVEEGDLGTANSLLGATEWITQTAGTLLGGVLAGTWGPHPSYVVNALSFGVSALLLLRIPSGRLQASPAPSRGHWRDLADGLEVVVRSRALLAVFCAWNLVMVGNALVNVGEISLAKMSLNAGDFGFGLLWTGSGLGSVLGSLLASPSLERRGLAPVYGGALALMGFGAGAAAVSPNVWVAFWCLFLLGIGNGTAIVANITLVQRGAPDHLRGRAFTILMTSTFAVLGLSMVGAGPLTDAVGARWVYGVACGVDLLAASVGLSLARSAERSGEQQPAPALS